MLSKHHAYKRHKKTDAGQYDIIIDHDILERHVLPEQSHVKVHNAEDCYKYRHDCHDVAID